jgi:hypothetical protein
VESDFQLYSSLDLKEVRDSVRVWVKVRVRVWVRDDCLVESDYQFSVRVRDYVRVRVGDGVKVGVRVSGVRLPVIFITIS